jgi:hypothetical protein
LVIGFSLGRPYVVAVPNLRKPSFVAPKLPSLVLEAPAGEIVELLSWPWTSVDAGGLRLASVARQRWPNLQIILTSGHMPSRAMKLPEGVLFFPKPYDLSDIRRSISG